MKELENNQLESINGGSWTQVGKIFGSGVAGAIDGAIAGSAVGPEGTVGGAIIGLGTGLTQGLIGQL